MNAEPPSTGTHPDEVETIAPAGRTLERFATGVPNLDLVLGGGLLLLYVAAAWSGWELSTAARQTLPADVRNSPGGYRSFHFWHSGYHGGK